jgi:hypothetical protein
MLAKTGARDVYQVLPDEREWLTVLTCINAAGESIPNFYIFRAKDLEGTTFNFVSKVQQWLCQAKRG